MTSPKDIQTFKAAMWYEPSACESEKCPLFGKCAYTKKQTTGRKYCGVEAAYMRTVTAPYLEIVLKLKDPFVAQWVGLHIVPLYQHLIKLKKIERGLDRPELVSSKRVLTIHPVYKEIRSVINEIRKEWKASGLDKMAQDEGYLASGLPAPVGADDMEGDKGYYEQLSEE